MKTLVKAALAFAALAAVVSCNKKQDPDPTPEIITANLTALSDKGVSESGSLNIFTVEASNASGDVFSAEFIGNRSYLAAGTYRLGSEVSAGNYRNASYNGKQVSEGDITVTKEENKYTITGVNKLSDGTILKLNATGELVYKEVVLEAQHIYNAACTPGEGGTYTWAVNVYSLSEELEASFSVMNTNADSPEGSYQLTGVEGIAPGKALTGYDLSILGLGKGGCYYCKGGECYFLQEGSGDVTISMEGDLLSVEVASVKCIDKNGAEVAAEAGTTLSLLYCKWGEVTPAGPEYEPLIVAAGSYKETVTAKEGLDEHTLVLKDAEGNVAGQVVIRTASGAEAIGGVYPYSADETAGTLIGGLDLSALGLGIVGSYYVKDGVNYTIGAGTATIEEAATGLNIVISDVVSACGETQGTASPISFLLMIKEADDPAGDPTDGVFTYTHSSEAKEGYSEHSVAVYFSNGNQFLNLLVAVPNGSAFAGDNIFAPAAYTITTTDQWSSDPKGYACPGFNFLGIMDLGCYYYVNGTINYLSEGIVKLVENADGLVVSITDSEGNPLEGAPASLALLSATQKAE